MNINEGISLAIVGNLVIINFRIVWEWLKGNRNGNTFLGPCALHADLQQVLTRVEILLARHEEDLGMGANEFKSLRNEIGEIRQVIAGLSATASISTAQLSGAVRDIVQLREKMAAIKE